MVGDAGRVIDVPAETTSKNSLLTTVLLVAVVFIPLLSVTIVDEPVLMFCKFLELSITSVELIL